MQREVIPTSPQYNTGSSAQPGPLREQQPVVGMMLLGVLAGAAAGFAASLFVLSQFDIQSQQIVIDTSGSSSSISQAASTLSPAVRERTVSIIGADGHLVAQGVIATTDGWIITPHAMEEGERVINSRRQEFVVEQNVPDPFTGLYFLKVDQTGLPVVTWSNQDEVSLGLWGLVMQLSPVATDQIFGQSISNVRTAAAQEQSLLRLMDSYTLASNAGVVDGVPYVAQNSRMIGLVVRGGNVIPGPVIERRLSFFIDHQIFQTLPDISTRSLFFDPTEGMTGLLVTYSGVADIQVDDVITGVAGVELTKQDQLWSRLLEQEVGSAVQLDLLRQGQPIQVMLSL
ncbi:MAG: hypothetical protein AAB558_04760 [Patescibacteria group bacterium]